jgi:hypothetical protein
MINANNWFESGLEMIFAGLSLPDNVPRRFLAHLFSLDQITAKMSNLPDKMSLAVRSRFQSGVIFCQIIWPLGAKEYAMSAGSLPFPALHI